MRWPPVFILKYTQKLKNISVIQKPELSSIPMLSESLKDLEQQGVRALVRYSGTEDILRVFIEAKEESMLQSSLDEILTLVN